jgi:glutamate-1-semialdehyde 2,1-aminomutase
MFSKTISKKLFAEASEFIPGGVNSPVRAFKAVGGDPVFIESGKGAYLYDVDGNEYIDLINSWGPMILGHAHTLVESALQDAVRRSTSFGAPSEIEVKMARLITEMMPSVEMVRMVNSGTEATMSAVRLARGFTGKEKIIKFEGCYHGHGDSFLIAAGSGAVTMGTPDSPGVTNGTAQDTLTALYNDLDSVAELIDKNQDQIAAIIVEPVAGNMGCVLPADGFLPGLREICDEHNIILIFDEVMTGFRLAPGGAQELYGLKADLTTLGKIIGGGMPVGAYGGRREIMQFVSPAGPVYQAGTLSGNPMAMHAGYALLQYLQKNPSIYDSLEKKTAEICGRIRKNLDYLSLGFTINRVGSMFTLFFNPDPVQNFEDARKSDLKAFGRYFNIMLEQGIYPAPSQFEALFVSDAIGEVEIDRISNANLLALKEI